MKPVKYLPFNKRKVNSEYRKALKRILKEKDVRGTVQFHGGEVSKFLGNLMEFDMRHGFPMITERKLETKDGNSEKMMRYAIAEVIGFIHGAMTLTALKKYGLPKYWWKRWTNLDHVRDKKGKPYFDLPKTHVGEHLGRFSYGGVWAKFPKENGGTTNQWKNVIKMAVKNPSAFTHHITNWYPPGIIVPNGKRKVVVAPCHGDVHIDIDPVKKILNLIHVQRAADVPVGVPYNMIHYPAIGMMLACVLGYEFRIYKHFMEDSHIYLDKQKKNVDILLKRKPKRLPTVTLKFKPTGNPVKDFFAIRIEHFHLSDYDAHPAMKIETEL